MKISKKKEPCGYRNDLAGAGVTGQHLALAQVRPFFFFVLLIS
jgi:hypothetical protein